MQISPLVAVVILNWNGKHYLEKFLPSVLASSYSNKVVIVADNASTDDSLDFLRAVYPEVKIIQLSQNFGFAKGYNEALKQVTADYFVLLNSDVEVSENWIGPVINLMESDRSIAACQPKLLMYHSRDQFEYAGAAGGFIDNLGYPFARGRIFDYCEADKGQYDEVIPVFWASGAAMFVRAELYWEAGGLDEFFFAHQEEIDLCWRLQLAGYKIYSCPLSVVYHVGGGTLPKGNAMKVFLNFRNNLIMICKNTPVAQLLWKLPLRICLDVVSALKSLMQGETAYFTAVVKAHFALFKWFFSSKKENKFPPKRKGKINGMYNGSIVWKHFVKGKKEFRELIS
ncbi:MAG TPA: glycosyltransferase family 2 protein [Parasegetibacter sp.]